MDGTLWDSAAEVAESWNETVKRAGYDRKPITVKDIQSVMGKTMDVIARILFPDLEEGERQKLLAQCGEEENDYLRIHGATLYPDIRRTMEQLKKKYHLYIVSNCQSGYIEAFLDYYKLHDLIEDTECYGNNEKSKGENIALLYRRNALDDAVYVGDIQGDYDASMDAAFHIFFMNPANCVYRNFHRTAHLMQKIKSSRCQSFFTISHKHMPCCQIGCPALFCQARILHRMYGDTAHQKFLLLFFRHLHKPMQRHMNGRTPQMHCNIREAVQNQPGVRVFTQLFYFSRKFFVCLFREIFFPQDHRIRFCGKHAR